MPLDIPDLKEQFVGFDKNFDLNSLENPQASLLKLASFMQLYDSAMKEISTKLEILDDEFQLQHSHNPIHHLECRVKGVKSILDKVQKHTSTISLDIIKEKVLDIAGIRIICNYTDDIYMMEKLLLKQSDVELIKRKDYIKNPKENGYRSLHIVVTVPVFLSERTELVPVEIQMRTTAMDYWASLEHKLRYKNDKDVDEYKEILLECANSLAITEQKMQEIHKNLQE